ncbi:hypothetical protein Barb6_01541 [Bacteroidales bacterium Barb6]|nr:hypothetical protein Barb6_01541 [Bacteroidales bacterium Barb6]
MSNVEGVTSLPSIFLNVSIAKFMEEYGIDTLRQKVSFAKISKVQAKHILDYISKISAEY